MNKVDQQNKQFYNNDIRWKQQNLYLFHIKVILIHLLQTNWVFDDIK